MANGAVGAAQAHMQRHHGALAEPDKRECRSRQVAAFELGIEKRFERRRGLVAAAPPLVRIAESEREPLPARRLQAALGRVRRDKSRLREEALPGAAELDEVVTVGSVAVQEDHQRLRRPRARLEPWSVELSGHSLTPLFLFGGALLALSSASRATQCVAPSYLC